MKETSCLLSELFPPEAAHPGQRLHHPARHLAHWRCRQSHLTHVGVKHYLFCFSGALQPQGSQSRPRNLQPPLGRSVLASSQQAREKRGPAGLLKPQPACLTCHMFPAKIKPGYFFLVFNSCPVALLPVRALGAKLLPRDLFSCQHKKSQTAELCFGASERGLTLAMLGRSRERRGCSQGSSSSQHQVLISNT